ncbi:nuclear transport factor 2 family protein [Saccharopolyspora karakumensis]|uniref:Nuclear transport factor 2 family protein n=1 Tax=Saccharopolyspora karakumensis TaxID=2530386 RepID=A0A4R5C0A6_9PSEU|nr:nuclear transport factor 2 family protein [Saccharopolyspora karakumensis]
MQWPSITADGVDFDGEVVQVINFIESGKASGVPQFVHTSVSGVDPTTHARPKRGHNSVFPSPVERWRRGKIGRSPRLRGEVVGLQSSADDVAVEAAVAAFAEGWRAPHPHAWDDLLADEVTLVQPLLRNRVGRHALAEEYGRLIELIPDLKGEVTRWAADGRTVRISLILTGTLGRLPLRLDITDQLTLDDAGRIRCRRAKFNPLPAVALLARQPAMWKHWWRSGVGPVLTRRKFLPHDLERIPTASLLRALALGVLFLAASAWLASFVSAGPSGEVHERR